MKDKKEGNWASQREPKHRNEGLKSMKIIRKRRIR